MKFNKIFGFSIFLTLLFSFSIFANYVPSHIEFNNYDLDFTNKAIADRANSFYWLNLSYYLVNSSNDNDIIKSAINPDDIYLKGKGVWEKLESHNAGKPFEGILQYIANGNLWLESLVDGIPIVKHFELLNNQFDFIRYSETGDFEIKYKSPMSPLIFNREFYIDSVRINCPGCERTCDFSNPALMEGCKEVKLDVRWFHGDIEVVDSSQEKTEDNLVKVNFELKDEYANIIDYDKRQLSKIEENINLLCEGNVKNDSLKKESGLAKYSLIANFTDSNCNLRIYNDVITLSGYGRNLGYNVNLGFDSKDNRLILNIKILNKNINLILKEKTLNINYYLKDIFKSSNYYDYNKNWVINNNIENLYSMSNDPININFNLDLYEAIELIDGENLSIFGTDYKNIDKSHSNLEIYQLIDDKLSRDCSIKNSDLITEDEDVVVQCNIDWKEDKYKDALGNIIRDFELELKVNDNSYLQTKECRIGEVCEYIFDVNFKTDEINSFEIKWLLDDFNVFEDNLKYQIYSNSNEFDQDKSYFEFIKNNYFMDSVKIYLYSENTNCEHIKNELVRMNNYGDLFLNFANNPSKKISIKNPDLKCFASFPTNYDSNGDPRNLLFIESDVMFRLSDFENLIFSDVQDNEKANLILNKDNYEGKIKVEYKLPNTDDGSIFSINDEIKLIVPKNTLDKPLLNFDYQNDGVLVNNPAQIKYANKLRSLYLDEDKLDSNFLKKNKFNFNFIEDSHNLIGEMESNDFLVSYDSNDYYLSLDDLVKPFLNNLKGKLDVRNEYFKFNEKGNLEVYFEPQLDKHSNYYFTNLFEFKFLNGNAKYNDKEYPIFCENNHCNFEIPWDELTKYQNLLIELSFGNNEVYVIDINEFSISFNELRNYMNYKPEDVMFDGSKFYLNDYQLRVSSDLSVINNKNFNVIDEISDLFLLMNSEHSKKFSFEIFSPNYKGNGRKKVHEGILKINGNYDSINIVYSCESNGITSFLDTKDQFFTSDYSNELKYSSFANDFKIYNSKEFIFINNFESKNNLLPTNPKLSFKENDYLMNYESNDINLILDSSCYNFVFNIDEIIDNKISFYNKNDLKFIYEFNEEQFTYKDNPFNEIDLENNLFKLKELKYNLKEVVNGNKKINALIVEKLTNPNEIIVRDIINKDSIKLILKNNIWTFVDDSDELKTKLDMDLSNAKFYFSFGEYEAQINDINQIENIRNYVNNLLKENTDEIIYELVIDSDELKIKNLKDEIKSINLNNLFQNTNYDDSEKFDVEIYDIKPRLYDEILYLYKNQDNKLYLDSERTFKYISKDSFDLLKKIILNEVFWNKDNSFKEDIICYDKEDDNICFKLTNGELIEDNSEYCTKVGESYMDLRCHLYGFEDDIKIEFTGRNMRYNMNNFTLFYQKKGELKKEKNLNLVVPKYSIKKDNLNFDLINEGYIIFDGKYFKLQSKISALDENFYSPDISMNFFNGVDYTLDFGKDLINGLNEFPRLNPEDDNSNFIDSIILTNIGSFDKLVINNPELKVSDDLSKNILTNDINLKLMFINGLNLLHESPNVLGYSLSNVDITEKQDSLSLFYSLNHIPFEKAITYSKNSLKLNIVVNPDRSIRIKQDKKESLIFNHKEKLSIEYYHYFDFPNIDNQPKIECDGLSFDSFYFYDTQTSNIKKLYTFNFSENKANIIKNKNEISLENCRINGKLFNELKLRFDLSSYNKKLYDNKYISLNYQKPKDLELNKDIYLNNIKIVNSNNPIVRGKLSYEDNLVCLMDLEKEFQFTLSSYEKNLFNSFNSIYLDNIDEIIKIKNNSEYLKFNSFCSDKDYVFLLEKDNIKIEIPDNSIVPSVNKIKNIDKISNYNFLFLDKYQLSPEFYSVFGINKVKIECDNGYNSYKSINEQFILDENSICEITLFDGDSIKGKVSNINVISGGKLEEKEVNNNGDVKSSSYLLEYYDLDNDEIKIKKDIICDINNYEESLDEFKLSDFSCNIGKDKYDNSIFTLNDNKISLKSSIIINDVNYEINFIADEYDFSSLNNVCKINNDLFIEGGSSHNLDNKLYTCEKEDSYSLSDCSSQNKNKCSIDYLNEIKCIQEEDKTKVLLNCTNIDDKEWLNEFSGCKRDENTFDCTDLFNQGETQKKIVLRFKITDSLSKDISLKIYKGCNFSVSNSYKLIPKGQSSCLYDSTNNEVCNIDGFMTNSSENNIFEFKGTCSESAFCNVTQNDKNVFETNDASQASRISIGNQVALFNQINNYWKIMNCSSDKELIDSDNEICYGKPKIKNNKITCTCPVIDGNECSGKFYNEVLENDAKCQLSNNNYCVAYLDNKPIPTTGEKSGICFDDTYKVIVESHEINITLNDFTFKFTNSSDSRNKDLEVLTTIDDFVVYKDLIYSFDIFDFSISQNLAGNNETCPFYLSYTYDEKDLNTENSIVPCRGSALEQNGKVRNTCYIEN